MLVPAGKKFPMAKPEVWVIVLPGQLSETDGAAQVTVAPHNPLSFGNTLSEGMPVITGSSMSITVTVKLQVAMFPEESVTTNVLVVVPDGNEDPDGKPAV